MKRTIFATILLGLSLALVLYAQPGENEVSTADLCATLRTAQDAGRQNVVDTLIARGKDALSVVNDILLDDDDAQGK